MKRYIYSSVNDKYYLDIINALNRSELNDYVEEVYIKDKGESDYPIMLLLKSGYYSQLNPPIPELEVYRNDRWVGDYPSRAMIKIDENRSHDIDYAVKQLNKKVGLIESVSNQRRIQEDSRNRQEAKHNEYRQVLSQNPLSDYEKDLIDDVVDEKFNSSQWNYILVNNKKYRPSFVKYVFDTVRNELEQDESYYDSINPYWNDRSKHKYIKQYITDVMEDRINNQIDSIYRDHNN